MKYKIGIVIDGSILIGLAMFAITFQQPVPMVLYGLIRLLVIGHDILDKLNTPEENHDVDDEAADEAGVVLVAQPDRIENARLPSTGGRWETHNLTERSIYVHSCWQSERVNLLPSLESSALPSPIDARWSDSREVSWRAALATSRGRCGER